VRELEVLLGLSPSVSRTTRTNFRETELLVVATIVAFAFLLVINESFSTIDRKHALRIPVLTQSASTCFFQCSATI